MGEAKKIYADRFPSLEEVYRSYRLTPADVRSIDRALADVGLTPAGTPRVQRPRAPRRTRPEMRRAKRK